MKFYSMGLCLALLFSSQYCCGQGDPEFPKGFITYLKFHNGMVTNFTSAPDQYVGGLQLAPQITVIEHLLRVGITGGGFYAGKKIQASLGPSLSVKLKTFKAGIFGSAGNINLSLDHLWGTGQQRLLAGGVVADIGNILTVEFTARRDYRLNSWVVSKPVRNPHQQEEKN